jgi:hypothetical protein
MLVWKRSNIFVFIPRFPSPERPNVLRQDCVNFYNPRGHIFMGGCRYCSSLAYGVLEG